ncbi:putative nudix hydrolase 7, partial [Dissostichus eleginoides]
TVDKLLPRFFRKYRQGSVCQLTNPDGMALTDVSWPTATNNPRGTSRKVTY